MTFSINDWNLNPNIEWYAVLSDSGSDILIEVYDENPSESPALIASANIGYGSFVSAELVQADGSPVDIEFFNNTLDYHLKVTGSAGDAQKTFRVGPFADLDDIEDPIYQSAEMRDLRAYEVINRHTRTKIMRTIELGVFENDIDVGDVVSMSLNRDSLNKSFEVEGFTITGTPDSVTKVLETVQYERFVK